ncbi:PREDICTED: uncharacterized protein LOC109587331 [Amphimedon queenslandica]|uniref:Uncharacterized protein n=2 Tax=Amphimedon queenslandica TaxID=400682 RepID=A0AAN0JQM2_AMPQE|nr:PREDICTED: uncharacterized protein LOC109587331 [Amphimedon queenslandica]|eukprot:XP_019859131.1 PREDICTED: uncharacterized protein LOC109587331 [Amphimedon queenslandica]
MQWFYLMLVLLRMIRIYIHVIDQSDYTTKSVLFHLKTPRELIVNSPGSHSKPPGFLIKSIGIPGTPPSLILKLTFKENGYCGLTGQYSVLRASDDDDDTPPPVPAYNPNGVQEYSELKREGEKKNKQQQQQQGAGPLYSTLNQDYDTPPPVPPAYNPEGVQEYSVLKREGEVSD